MSVTEIDVKTHRADFDQLTKSLYETTSWKRAIWNEVKKVFASVDCGADVIKNMIKPALRVIVSPSGNVIKKLPIKWKGGSQRKEYGAKIKLGPVKSYTNNRIKESRKDIRISERIIALFHSNTKSGREYCMTSLHVLHLGLSILEILIKQLNYTYIPTYVFQADATLAHASQSLTKTPPVLPPPTFNHLLGPAIGSNYYSFIALGAGVL
ncbi:hypothetical protein PILCRDRAFT_88379 [Piloderma croceum F 1598]|uniref:Uncharacterized protein n=1 Tax=Piloderma croceum (strain F 1598) TaxID=765440 RepID=A0A0C3FSP3_PILCF|nr:hypothetical protein PILCRDRAFT_88379 [Piloderma croceum F 1598]